MHKKQTNTGASLTHTCADSTLERIALSSTRKAMHIPMHTCKRVLCSYRDSSCTRKANHLYIYIYTHQPMYFSYTRIHTHTDMHTNKHAHRCWRHAAAIVSCTSSTRRRPSISSEPSTTTPPPSLQSSSPLSQAPHSHSPPEYLPLLSARSPRSLP